MFAPVVADCWRGYGGLRAVDDPVEGADQLFYLAATERERVGAKAPAGVVRVLTAADAAAFAAFQASTTAADLEAA